MFSSFLITFRETLEAVLVISIVLAFLSETNQVIFKKFVWWGICTGLLISIALAFILQVLFGGFEGKTEEIFEGTLMFLTAGFITWMILWIHNQKDIAVKIKKKIAFHAEKGYGVGILILIATAISREGTETVLYLKASSAIGQSNQLTGAFLGIICSLLLGYIIFRWALHSKLYLVFKITGIYLLLFAAGLISSGVHEFQEAGLLPIFFFDPLINISGVFDHKSGLGSLMRSLFGYTSKPTFIEIFSYVLYVGFIILLKKRLISLKNVINV